MMMPANYSAVAETEIIYGGAGIADYLPNAWKASNVKQFTTNIVTLVSNTFTDAVLAVTLGTMFGGNWGKDGVKLFGDDGSFSSFMKYGMSPDNWADGTEMTGLNKFMTGLGIAASVYTLGTAPAKIGTEKNVVEIHLIDSAD